MQEKLTVILFKNHLTSRTFEVSLKKIERIGVSFVVVIFLAFFSSIFFIRAGLKMLHTQDSRSVQKAEDLERQLSEMKTSYEALQAHLSGSPSTGSSLSQSSLRSVLFTSIPTNSVRSPIPSRESLPFRLETIKSRWQGNFLYIDSAIEYTKGDEGTQQGNFFVVAQGPENLYAHPKGAFSESGSENLMDPDSGEYFSVARYREVRAKFGPVERRDQINSISIYIFDRNKNLIFLDRVKLKESLKEGAEAPPMLPSTSEGKARRVLPPAVVPHSDVDEENTGEIKVEPTKDQKNEPVSPTSQNASPGNSGN